MTGLKIIFGEHWFLFQFLPVALELISAFLIFRLLRQWGIRLAFLAPLAYLFSFTVLATSDYATGVQAAILFMLLGLTMHEEKKTFLSGFFFALGFLTKFYILPAFIGFLLVDTLRKQFKNVFRCMLGAFCASIIFWGPFWILSPGGVWQDNFIMHLNRPVGLSKYNVLSFFVSHEWLLLSLAFLGIYGVIRLKLKFPEIKIENWGVVFIFLFLSSFFAAFKDIYYMYLDSLIPFVVILAFLFISRLRASGKLVQKTALALILLIYSGFMLSSFIIYQQGFRFADRFLNANEIADYLRTLPENKKIYGAQDSASLLALLAERQLANNLIDTNTQVFASGTYDLEKTSEQLVSQGIYLIARVMDLPQYGIQDAGYEGYFSAEVFKKSCRRIKDFPSRSSGLDNKIAVYDCQKTGN